MNSADHRRSSTSRQRWHDLALYAFFGVTVVAGVSVLFPARPASIPLVAWMALSLASIALPFVLARWSRGEDWVTWFGLRHWLSYPPCWIAGVLGGAVVVAWTTIDTDLLRCVARLRSPDSIVLGLLPVVAICIGIVVVGVRSATAHQRHAPARPRLPSGPPTDEACLLFDECQSLHSWLANDTEIGDPNYDAFGHAAVAYRMANRLSEPPAEGSIGATIALVGDLGSGKSSIQRLTEYFLRADGRLGRRMEIVQVSLWTYEDPGGAVEGVLNHAIDALSAHVDVLALAGLPREYASTIESVGGPFSRLAPTFTSREGPSGILKRLSNVLAAIDLELILWVEDLERFAGDSPSVISLDHSSRLAPVRGLLYLLHRTPGLRVVIASRSLYEGFDVEKIARFIEQTPAVEPAAAWRVIRRFLLCMQEGTPSTIEDPKRLGQDSLLFGLGASEPSPLLFYEVHPGEPPVHLAIARLLNTPRKIKTALREAREVWTHLPGEIDLEDVICASVLKAARPNVYSWCDQHLDFLRTGNVSSIDPKASTKAREAIRAELEALMTEGHTKAEENATRSLLMYLFPAWVPGKRNGGGWRPQRIGAPWAKDYWRRFVHRTPIPWETSDQRVLKAIRAWPHNSRELLDLMFDMRTIGSVEQFGSLVDRTNTCELLDGVAMRLQHIAGEVPASEPHPAISAVRRMMNERPPPQAEIEQYLLRVLGRLIPSNLAAALSVVSYFCSNAQGITPLLSMDGDRRVRRSASSLLADSFPPHGPGDLVAALKGSYLYFLSHLAHQVFKEEMEGGVPGEQWNKFAQALLLTSAWDRATT